MYPPHTHARSAADIYENAWELAHRNFMYFFPTDFICCINKIHGSGTLPLIIIPCCPTNCVRLLQATVRLTMSRRFCYWLLRGAAVETRIELLIRQRNALTRTLGLY